jgi:hypothetical protein
MTDDQGELGFTPFAILPEELVIEILVRLPTIELPFVRGVCSWWKQLIDGDLMLFRSGDAVTDAVRNVLEHVAGVSDTVMNSLSTERSSPSPRLLFCRYAFSFAESFEQIQLTCSAALSMPGDGFFVVADQCSVSTLAFGCAPRSGFGNRYEDVAFSVSVSNSYPMIQT